MCEVLWQQPGRGVPGYLDGQGQNAFRRPSRTVTLADVLGTAEWLKCFHYFGPSNTKNYEGGGGGSLCFFLLEL